MTELFDIPKENLSNEEIRAIDRFKARNSFDGWNHLKIVETAFLRENNFEAGEILNCDYDGRKFYLSKDLTQYYCTPAIHMKRFDFKIRKISDITKVELMDDKGNDVARMMKGAFWFGAIGGLVAGGAKDCKIFIRITTKNYDEPIVDMYILTDKCSKNYLMKVAENANVIFGKLQHLTGQTDSDESLGEGKKTSAADEIRKFKALMDDGIITPEEFEAKKKQLLGI